MKDEGQSIRNWIIGIVGTVIAGLLLAGFNYWIPSLWSFTKTAVLWCWNIATYPVGVPFWAICLTVVFVVPTIVQLWKMMRGPTWRDYTEDNFNGLRWRWSWEFGVIRKLLPYCPNDDTTLVYDEYDEHGQDWGSDHGRRVVWQCETCGRRFGPISGRLSEVMAAIGRQIDRKVRKGEWKAINDL